MNQDTFVGFLEGFGLQLFLKEAYLFVTKLGKVVQTGVFFVVIGFVFSTIQHDDTGIAPVESTIRFSAYIVEVLAETNGVSIADFMVASYK